MSKIKRERRPEARPKQRLQVLTWYQAVRAREGLNDCQLDIKFCVGPDGEPRTRTADRMRVFEAVRRRWILPSVGDHRKRNYDLAKKINDTTGYAGTENILRSPFWQLTQNYNLSLQDIREIVVECIFRLGLHRASGDFDDDGVDEISDLESMKSELSLLDFMTFLDMGDSRYEESLTQAFIHLEPSLDYIALMGALAIECIFAGKIHIARRYVETYLTVLKAFCRQPWLGDLKEELYKEGETRIAHELISDALASLPDYLAMVGRSSESNFRSPAVAFLKRHQRLIWRKTSSLQTYSHLSPQDP